MCYKLISWLMNGAKIDYTGRYDTFNYCPEIGILSALNIEKIDKMRLQDENLVDHFCNQ